MMTAPQPVRYSPRTLMAALAVLGLFACKTASHGSATADFNTSAPAKSNPASANMDTAPTGAAPSSATEVDQGAAANAGLAQLSRYFAAWEVPNAAANFPLTAVIGPVYNFKSPFGETYSGRDAMLKSITAFSSQVPPMSITMTTLTWNATKNPDGSVTATSSVLGESQTQGGPVTGLSLAYQVNLDPVNGAPPLINTMLESAVSGPQSEPALTGHVPNAGRATLYYWFFYFEDLIGDPTPLARLINTNSFNIQLDDGTTTVTNTADLATWYQAYAAKYKQAYNKVSNFQISESSAGAYDMSFDTIWTGVRADGGLDQGRRHEVWKLVDSNGPFALIESRVVTVTSPVQSL